jgi:hypothetical protein
MRQPLALLVALLVVTFLTPPTQGSACVDDPARDEVLALDVADPTPHEPSTNHSIRSFYIDETGIYEESNQHSGLQARAGSCQDAAGRVVEYEADTALAAL